MGEKRFSTETLSDPPARCRADQDREKYWPAATPSAARALILSVEGSCGRSDGSLRAAAPSISEGEGAAAYRPGLRGQNGPAEQALRIGQHRGHRSPGLI